MEVIIQPNVEQAAELTARLIAARLRAKLDLVLGLATGRTMERVYDRLADTQRGEGLDFSRCRTFKLGRVAQATAKQEFIAGRVTILGSRQNPEADK